MDTQHHFRLYLYMYFTKMYNSYYTNINQQKKFLNYKLKIKIDPPTILTKLQKYLSQQKKNISK